MESMPSTPHSSIPEETPRPSTSRQNYMSRKRHSDRNNTNTLDLMNKVGKKLENLNPKDSFNIFGEHVANKLRTLTVEQNIFAQKLINDVLFEGEMESLTRNFRILDTGKPQKITGVKQKPIVHEKQKLISPQQAVNYQYLPQQFNRTRLAVPVVQHNIAQVQQPSPSSPIGFMFQEDQARSILNLDECRQEYAHSSVVVENMEHMSATDFINTFKPSEDD